MTDVERGGATVFPNIGQAVKPSKVVHTLIMLNSKNTVKRQ